MSKQPIIYSGVFDSGSGWPTYFAARIFTRKPGRHRIAGWHDDDTRSFKSALSGHSSFLNRDFADDAEAIAWLLAGEKGGAP